MIIKIEQHHYNHSDPAIEQKLDRILKLLEKQTEIIMADLTKLQEDVAAETTVIASAKALIQGLADQIKAAGTDQAALKAVTDQMEANAADLAAAIQANTPQSSQ